VRAGRNLDSVVESLKANFQHGSDYFKVRETQPFLAMVASLPVSLPLSLPLFLPFS
jgi:hypothetical protein